MVLGFKLIFFVIMGLDVVGFVSGFFVVVLDLVRFFGRGLDEIDFFWVCVVS